jgi:hypothetical protein
MSRIDKAKADRERLQAEAEHHRAKLTGILEKLQRVENFIQDWGYYGDEESGDEVSQEPLSAGASTGIANDSPFYGMGQPGAVTLLLQMEGRNLTTVEVTSGLQQHGFEFATKDPVRAVDWALKRAAEAGHVIKIDRGLWVASPNANPAALETNARSSRTRAGLEVARRRGVRLGTPPKITEDHRRLAVSLFEQGETINQIARRCGVTATGLGKRIKEWREDGRFPPPRPKGRRKKAEPEDHDRGMIH